MLVKDWNVTGLTIPLDLELSLLIESGQPTVLLDMSLGCYHQSWLEYCLHSLTVQELLVRIVALFCSRFKNDVDKFYVVNRSSYGWHYHAVHWSELIRLVADAWRSPNHWEHTGEYFIRSIVL